MSDKKISGAAQPSDSLEAAAIVARRYRRLMTGWLIVPFCLVACSMPLACLYSDKLLVFLAQTIVPVAVVLVITAWLYSCGLVVSVCYRTRLKWYILAPKFESLFIVLILPPFVLLWWLLPGAVQHSVVGSIALLMLYLVATLSIRQFARSRIEAELHSFAKVWLKLSQFALRDLLLLRVLYDFD